MDFDETMVEEEEFDEAVEDDAPFDGFVEEDESEDEDFPDDEELEIPDEDDEEDPEDDEAGEEQDEPEPQPQQSEPGWIKQRVGKAVEKAVRETEARMQAKFDAQLAPLLEKMMEDEAKELVRSGEVKNLETAMELVRLRRGQPTTANPVPGTQARGEQPRNEQGQFVSKEQIAQEAATQARINELAKQVDKIKAKGGPDVIKEFQTNPDIKRRVIDGELDFYDVAEIMSKPKRRHPSPQRSPNGTNNYASNAFADMSDKEFDRMERQIDKGVRYTFK